MSERSCPKCTKTKLRPETVAEIQIDRCPSCRGLLLDKGELLKLLEAEAGLQADNIAFSPISDAMDAVPGHCRACDMDMGSVRCGEVKVDMCRGCGVVFLDEGELASLQLMRS